MTSSIWGKNPINRTQSPDMTLAVDWDVKHQFKQTILSFECHRVSFKHPVPIYTGCAAIILMLHEKLMSPGVHYMKLRTSNQCVYDVIRRKQTGAAFCVALKAQI